MAQPSQKPSAVALAKFEERFAKTFGEGTLKTIKKINPYEVISTGSLTLDYMTGVGGLVEGRLAEYWGVDSIGKTTMALLAIAEAQRKHPAKMTAFIDMEQTFDSKWAETNGVDLSRLRVYTPESAEDVADALKEIVRSALFSIVVLDSIGAMIPEAEKEKDADEAVMAQQAKIVTRMIKIAAVEAAKTSTVVLLINQVRANLAYGSDITTGGGFALKHSTTHKMKFKTTGTSPYKVRIGGEERVVGREVAIEVERNKVAPNRRVAIFNLFTVPSKLGPVGVDKVDEAFTLGVKLGIIKQEGAWYTLPSGDRQNGKEKVIEALRSDLDVVSDIREKAIATRVDEIIIEEAIPEPEPKKNGKTPNFKKGRPS
jgi:recombination protein RecA